MTEQRLPGAMAEAQAEIAAGGKQASELYLHPGMMALTVLCGEGAMATNHRAQSLQCWHGSLLHPHVESS